ncbi:tetratricopeptide repeat protein [Striga asiatica]|uniref:Tetratricopeptide repeat protein n=1 Tax=Striga asiatica TaxID=4170 RepID=A0A5A7P5A2_STRAF|nr:tetratricopeptide repeat protein [Striga asiatica]
MASIISLYVHMSGRHPLPIISARISKHSSSLSFWTRAAIKIAYVLAVGDDWADPWACMNFKSLRASNNIPARQNVSTATLYVKQSGPWPASTISSSTAMPRPGSRARHHPKNMMLYVSAFGLTRARTRVSMASASSMRPHLQRESSSRLNALISGCVFTRIFFFFANLWRWEGVDRDRVFPSPFHVVQKVADYTELFHFVLGAGQDVDHLVVRFGLVGVAFVVACPSEEPES